ncbi:MAG TPA: matrixin family metalloprotease [Pyrinomonadaceae bacterium]|nr:matrixin family metalloprotease [Pyrinomonadaceae bacterium]
MRRFRPALAIVVLMALGVSSQPSSFEPVVSHEQKIKWPTRTVTITLSSSLTEPAGNIIEGSDVLGAIDRALNSWTTAAGVKFVVKQSKEQSISPANRGDGINLITIAATDENLAIFADTNNAARTRVFFDRESGNITEADIVINPFPYSDVGELLQFSTDGTSGTYDLESTLAHEIGHLLGLSHSAVVGSTMQISQALNGTNGVPAFTQRTLSHVDHHAVRDLYGPCQGNPAVKGKILNSTQGNLLAANGVHVWIEDLSSGRVVASALADNRGEFSMGCVPPGDYRAMVEYSDLLLAEQPGRGKSNSRSKQFRSVEINNSFRVMEGRSSVINYVLVPPYNSPRALQTRLFGAHGDLSTVALAVTAGSKLTVFIEGPGVDQVPGSGFLISSPFISIDASTLTLQRTRGSAPVVSFELLVGENVAPGDYTIRLQSNSGELAYLVGAITVEAP